MSGTLFGVGVGPGDPELMTLKAARLIASASIIAYPAPDTGESFARAIAAEYIRPDTIEMPIIVPMRPDAFPHEIYAQAASKIGAQLNADKDVVVLCEGDPFFYGSFMYLYDLLSPQFDVQIIPGVSSITACAAVAGQPLAGRNAVLTIIPGPSNETAIRKQLISCEAAAIMKVGRHFSRIRNTISELGLLDKATYVERATLETQQVMPLAEVNVEQAPYFSMILIDKGNRPNQSALNTAEVKSDA